MCLSYPTVNQKEIILKKHNVYIVSSNEIEKLMLLMQKHLQT